MNGVLFQSFVCSHCQAAMFAIFCRVINDAIRLDAGAPKPITCRHPIPNRCSATVYNNATRCYKHSYARFLGLPRIPERVWLYLIFDTWAWYFLMSFLTSFLTLGNYPDYPLQPEYKPQKISWIQWARDVFIVPMAHHGPGFRPKEPYPQVPVRSLPPACPGSGSGPQPFWAAAISRYDSICIQM